MSMTVSCFARTHTRAHTHTCTCARTRAHTPLYCMAFEMPTFLLWLEHCLT